MNYTQVKPANSTGDFIFKIIFQKHFRVDASSQPTTPASTIITVKRLSSSSLWRFTIMA